MNRPLQHDQETSGSRTSTDETVGELSNGLGGKEALDLLWVFDSNGRFIDTKRLWKKKGSQYKQCGTLHKIAELVREFPYKSLKYIFLSVGTNDLDTKDHDQVLGELMLLVDEIRAKYPGIKFIINELLPRRDNRNTEVGKFNAGLNEFASSLDDITIASQTNMSDTTMLHDVKHLREDKVPLYAKNIIRAMLTAYGIREKSELFVDQGERFHPTSNQRRSIQDRFKSLANYNTTSNKYIFPPKTNYNSRQGSNNDSSNNTPSNETVIRNALMQFGEVLVKCIQR